MSRLSGPDEDAMLRTIRRLQAENERLVADNRALRGDVAYLQVKVEALENHHAAFTAGVADSTLRYSSRVARLESEIAERNTAAAADQAELDLAAQSGRAKPLTAALTDAIRAHPDLFAPEAYAANASTD